MSRKIGLLIILILAGVILYSLGQQIYNSLIVAKRLDAEADKLSKLELQNQELKKQAEESGSIGFIEQQARNKLGMARIGETVVIIPQSEIDRLIESQKPVVAEQLPNWQGWLKLFLN